MVHRVWREAGLKPHRLERYMASDDPDFERKAADVIGLYLNPPQHAAVFCVHEKTALRSIPRLLSRLANAPFLIKWMHRTRGRCSRQTGVGWSHSPNSAARTTTTNDWQRDPARNRSVLVVSDERGQRGPCRRVKNS